MTDKQKVMQALALIGPGYPKTKIEVAQYLGWTVYDVVCALSRNELLERAKIKRKLEGR